MIVCPRCARSFIPTNSDAGESVRCPNCHLDLDAPNPPETDDGAGQGRGEEDEYALRVEAPSPTAEVAREYVPLGNYTAPRMLPDEDVEVEEREVSPWQAVRPAPPRDLFFAGTFNFPFRPAARAESLSLTIGATITLLVFELTLWCMRSGGDGPSAVFSTTPTIAGLLFALVGLLFLAAYLVAAAVHGMAILRDTAFGCDAVKEWPNLLSLDSTSDAKYVFMALAIGVLPGMVTAPLWDWLGWSKLLMMAISAAILFPLLLLSMLETNSPIMPVSPPVWQSVYRAWQTWGLYYLITLPAAAGICGLAIVAMTRGGLGSALVVGILVSPVWMIYCRLLGRLAWFCSGGVDAAPV
jgi:hypothetical protein